jgi:S-adenosylmethionine hydrolase
VRQISKEYSEAAMGDVLAIFNSLNLLEIAVYRGNFAKLWNININSVVHVKFINNKLF